MKGMNDNSKPWNKGKIVGRKAPLRLRDIWAIRVRLQLRGRLRELALFNLAIDSARATISRSPTRRGARSRPGLLTPEWLAMPTYSLVVFDGVPTCRLGSTVGLSIVGSLISGWTLVPTEATRCAAPKRR